MRGWLLGVLVVVTAWAQVSLFGNLRPLGVMPDLILILVVLFALRLNATPALAAAVGGGWLIELAAGGSGFGIRMGCFTVITLTIIAGRQLGLSADSVITGLVMVLLATILFNAAVLATLGVGVPRVALGIVGREIIDNLVITLFIYIVRANLRRQVRPGLEVGQGSAG